MDLQNRVLQNRILASDLVDSYLDLARLCFNHNSNEDVLKYMAKARTLIVDNKDCYLNGRYFYKYRKEFLKTIELYNQTAETYQKVGLNVKPVDSNPNAIKL